MHLTKLMYGFLVVCSLSFTTLAVTTPLEYDDVFEIEFVSDPQPDRKGEQILFVRNWMDRQTDRRRAMLWLADSKGQLQALTGVEQNAHSPRWSPDNSKVAYIAGQQIHLYWLSSGRNVQLSRLTQVPANLSWSPDGRWLAFTARRFRRQSNIIKRYNYVVLIQPWCASLEHLMHCIPGQVI
ncbi:Tol-Pal system protein TolB [Alishewanella longhuensis]